MLRTGLFTTPDKSYTIYELDTTGYYRIDIMEHGAAFQVDFESVVYSQVKRKQTLVYGDSLLYDKFINLKQKAVASKLDVTKSSEWKDGTFLTHIMSVSRKGDVSISTEKTNNIVTSETIIIDGYTIMMYVEDAEYSVKLDPINLSSYESLSLSKDSIDTDAPNVPFHSVETLRRRLPLDHIYKNDFVVADADDINLARRRLDEWVASKEEYKGFDTETSGLDINIYGTDKLVGIILGETETKSTYFAFGHKSDVNNLPKSFMDELMAKVKTQESKLVAHNKKFDRQVMMTEGYDLRIRWCTYQIAMVLDPLIGKDHPHDLKTLILQLTGLRYAELSDIFINEKDIDFAILPKSLIHLYACADGSNVIRLIKEQMKVLPKNQRKLVDMECALSDVKADQEYYGMRVDVKKYERNYRNCMHVRDMLLDAFRKLTGEDGNINSAAVLQNLLYNRMKCDILLRTNSGLPSVSSKAIEKLGAEKTEIPRAVPDDLKDMFGKVVVSGEKLAKAKYPALLILDKYKKYNKLITAFYARFERTMKTGRIFFWINQNGAQSGRQSSPMHQLPPELKEVMLSDAEDRDFWGPDYSQVELRMMAYQAQEPELIRLCSDPENDVHRVIGSLINGCEMWEITKSMRDVGKRRNFGVVYMIKNFGLAQQLFGPGPTKEQLQFAQQQLDDFFKRFKRTARFIARNAKIVERLGYMETRWFHRKRMFPEIFNPDLEPRKRSSIYRMANNMPIQGTAADLLKYAEVLMYEYIRKKGWNVIMPDGFPMVRMMLSIHDEIIFSIHKDIVYEEILKMIRDCMEITVEGAPPFFVEPVKMDNWGDHASEGLKVPVKLRDKLIADYDRTGVSVMNADTYADIVNGYNESLLHDYMTDLISKYGTDHIAVGTHVRHPVLTHSLLGIYEKKIPKEWEHVDRINEAARMYIEELLSGENVKEKAVIFNVQNKLEDKADDAEVEQSLEVSYGDLSGLVSYDKDGNVVFEENEQEDLSDVWYDMSEDYDQVLAEAKNDPKYVYELGDCVVFDIDELSKTSANEVLQYIGKIREEDGFYRAMVYYGGRLLDTTMRIENIDVDDANKFVMDRMVTLYA